MKYEQKVIEVMKLETKDIVELRNGSFCLVVGDILIDETGYLQTKYYTEDLRKRKIIINNFLLEMIDYLLKVIE